MNKFKIGDVIKLKDSKDSKTCFIIVDVIDFSSLDQPNFEYEIIKIFPIQESNAVMCAIEDNIDIHVKYNSAKFKMLMEFIEKERAKRGLFNKSDYMKILEISLKKRKGSKLDAIRYDQIGTIDECLDALYDLDSLYKNFGDEAFLQLKDLVKKRINKLM